MGGKERQWYYVKAIFKQTFNFKVLFHQMVMLSGLDKFHSIDHYTKKIQKSFTFQWVSNVCK